MTNDIESFFASEPEPGKGGKGNRGAAPEFLGSRDAPRFIFLFESGKR
jgi:hypothetical protein